MKIILSRKGLDSRYGGIPSPVLQNDKGYQVFYTIPIPDEDSNVKYSQLKLYGKFKVSDFLNNVPLKSMKYETCHLDPDIRRSIYKDKPPDGWQPAFGQSHIAQDHLRINEVGAGDLFLFFGWFQFADYDDKKFLFIKNDEYPNGFHAVYGYLQVEKPYDLNKGFSVPKGLNHHPHVINRNKSYYRTSSNTIYAAKPLFEDMGCKEKLQGSGIFRFSKDLILTKKGQPYRTIWELDQFFHPENGVEISYNPAKRWSSTNEKAILKSAYRGQEFIVRSDPKNEIKDWGVRLVKNHAISE